MKYIFKPKNRIEELENDNKEIRQANADVMLKLSNFSIIVCSILYKSLEEIVSAD